MYAAPWQKWWRSACQQEEVPGGGRRRFAPCFWQVWTLSIWMSVFLWWWWDDGPVKVLKQDFWRYLIFRRWILGCSRRWLLKVESTLMRHRLRNDSWRGQAWSGKECYGPKLTTAWPWARRGLACIDHLKSTAALSALSGFVTLARLDALVASWPSLIGHQKWPCRADRLLSLSWPDCFSSCLHQTFRILNQFEFRILNFSCCWPRTISWFPSYPYDKLFYPRVYETQHL